MEKLKSIVRFHVGLNIKTKQIHYLKDKLENILTL